MNAPDNRKSKSPSRDRPGKISEDNVAVTANKDNYLFELGWI